MGTAGFGWDRCSTLSHVSLGNDPAILGGQNDSAELQSRYDLEAEKDRLAGHLEHTVEMIEVYPEDQRTTTAGQQNWDNRESSSLSPPGLIG
jgi:hypothetical protein